MLYTLSTYLPEQYKTNCVVIGYVSCYQLVYFTKVLGKVVAWIPFSYSSNKIKALIFYSLIFICFVLNVSLELFSQKEKLCPVDT